MTQAAYDIPGASSPDDITPGVNEFRAPRAPAAPKPAPMPIPAAPVTISPRSMVVNGAVQTPPAQAQTPFQPWQNNKDLMDSKNALQWNQNQNRQQAYQAAQRQIVGASNIPGTTQDSPQANPTGSLRGSFPSLDQQGNAIPSAYNNVDASAKPPVNPSPASMYQGGPYDSSGNPNLIPGVRTAADAYNGKNLNPIGTLKGSFQAHDDQGNAIPGVYNSVDKSAPRSAVNLEAIQKDNFRTQYDAKVAPNDPSLQPARDKVQNVKDATAAGMTVKDYNAKLAKDADFAKTIPQGVTADDWKAMTPKDRAEYTQKNQTESARQTSESDKSAQQQSQFDAKLKQDREIETDRIHSQVLQTYGKEAAGVVKSGFAFIGKLYDTKVKADAEKAKTTEQRKSKYDLSEKQYENASNHMDSALRAKHVSDDDIANIKKIRDQHHQELMGQLYPEYAAKKPDAAPPAPTKQPATQPSTQTYSHTATGPNGEKVGWDGSNWVPIK